MNYVNNAVENFTVGSFTFESNDIIFSEHYVMQINLFSSSPLFINLAVKRQAFFPRPQKFF